MPPSQDEHKKSETSEYYLTARREWLERYGDYIAQAKNWRMMAFGAMGIAALFGAGMVYEADRVHVVPYVVEVNKLGQSVHLAEAVNAGTYQTPIVRYVLADWIEKVRERLPAVAAEKEVYRSTYNFLAGNESQKLTSYYQRHNPYNNYVKNLGGRTVTINSILPVSTITAKGGTMQAQWTETQYGENGSIQYRKTYEGTVTYIVRHTTNLTADPFGIYITSFTWNPLP